MAFNPNKPESAQAIFRFPLFPDPPEAPENLPDWIRNHLVPAFAAAFDDHTHSFPQSLEGQLTSNRMTTVEQPTPADAGPGAIVLNATTGDFEGSDGTDWLIMSGGAGSPHQIFLDFGTRSVAFTA